jgi:hypothetical protein
MLAGCTGRVFSAAVTISVTNPGTIVPLQRVINVI